MPDPPRERFPKTARLAHQRDFDRVFRSRTVAADGVLIVHAARNHLDHPRLGISVSRKVGNAVVRNRWKRLIREAFRRQQLAIPRNLDLVVRPQRGAVADHHAIRQALVALARKLDRRLINPSNRV